MGRCTAVGLVVSLAFAAFYAGVAGTTGFDGPVASWAAYGEPPAGPPIEQPICFWTDLGFVLSGLLVLRRLDRAAPDEAHPLRRPSAFGVALGLIVLWMGPGSMLEHGTLRSSWGWFDAASIHWLGLFVTGWCVLRSIPGAYGSRAGPIAFWAFEGAAAVAIGAWTWSSHGARDLATVGALAVMTASVLTFVALGHRAGRFDAGAWGRVGAASLAFAVAIAFLVLGGQGRPLAPWGHGAWHLASAAGTYLLYGVLAAER